ncbi:MAG: hypothetical protein J5689_00075 [Clostridia bacterium]|nr:hypothetical protein [Clostridia bacterium]
MKNVSKIMYTIGKVFNIIEIVGAAIMVALGILIMANPTAIAEEAVKQGASAIDTPAQAYACGIFVLITSIIALVVAVVIFALAKKATKDLKEEPKKVTAHTIMLVIGIFGDLFYFLGGLFGILSTSNLGSNEQKEKE